MMNATQEDGVTTRRRLVVGLVGGALAGVIGRRAVHAEQGQGDAHRAIPRETGATPSNPPPLNESEPTTGFPWWVPAF